MPNKTTGDSERKSDSERKKAQRDSGLPGGGAGRKDYVGESFVYPMSGPHPPGEAEIVTPGSWGQGKRGAAGYQDAGESELNIQFVAPEKCRDLMTKDPVCCQEADTAEEAAHRMRERDIGLLPVVSNLREKKLLGVITDRDLVVRLLAEGRDPREFRVGEIMTREVEACSPDDPCDEALRIMGQHRVRRVPAVDDSGRVVGIIAQADVALRMRDRKQTAGVVEAISQPG